jgi:hypothetical protein
MRSDRIFTTNFSKKGGTPSGEPMEPTMESLEDDLDADHDDAPLRLCPMHDVIEDAVTPGLTRWYSTLSLTSPLQRIWVHFVM